MKYALSLILVAGMALALPAVAGAVLCANNAGGNLVVRKACRKTETVVGRDVVRGLGFRGDPGPGLAITDVAGRQVGRVLRLSEAFQYRYGAAYGYGGYSTTITDTRAAILTPVDAGGQTDWVTLSVDSAGFVSGISSANFVFTETQCTQGRSLPLGSDPKPDAALSHPAFVDDAGIAYYVRGSEKKTGTYYFVAEAYGSTADEAAAQCDSAGGALIGLVHPCCSDPGCLFCQGCCEPVYPGTPPLQAAPVHTVDTKTLGTPPFKVERIEN